MTKYVKLVNNQIQYPPKNKGSIINYDLDIDLLIQDGYKEFIEVERPTTIRLYHIQYVETNVITETIVYDETQEEAEERIAQEERNRLDLLFLTPSDIERALYKAKGMDFEDLKELIAQSGAGIDLKALAIEFRANNFYRGAKFGNSRLIDVVGNLLGYTPQDMDYLFENKELPVVNEE